MNFDNRIRTRHHNAAPDYLFVLLVHYVIRHSSIAWRSAPHYFQRISYCQVYGSSRRVLYFTAPTMGSSRSLHNERTANLEWDQ